MLGPFLRVPFTPSPLCVEGLSSYQGVLLHLQRWFQGPECPSGRACTPLVTALDSHSLLSGVGVAHGASALHVALQALRDASLTQSSRTQCGGFRAPHPGPESRTVPRSEQGPSRGPRPGPSLSFALLRGAGKLRTVAPFFLG